MPTPGVSHQFPLTVPRPGAGGTYKYGVITTADLKADLLEWRYLYAAQGSQGRSGSGDPNPV